MTDYKAVNQLSRLALQHWGEGRLDAAEDGFVQAIAALGAEGNAADLHAQLAGVLDAAGRLEEAVTQSELALAGEQSRGQADDQPLVKVARYFLADRLARLGRAQPALGVLAPSLAALPDDWLLNTAQAEALHVAGRHDEARAAAAHALAHAGSETKRAQLAERLAPLLLPS
ncbi:MAG: hypothetical protein EOP35_16025 [Rubrivivax sp.]|nr:MAG: hypothetical protein EOP35_16025 [Rubrivivax sp.]